MSLIHHLCPCQPEGVVHPFNRATVQVTTALLDSNLPSLAFERSDRLSRDQTAYQVLATSYLLLGMRLVRHRQKNDALASSHLLAAIC